MLFYIVYFLVSAVFLQGVIQMLFGGFGARLVIEGLLVVLFLFVLLKKDKRLPLIISFSFFLLSYVISGLINGDLNFDTSTFFRPFIYSYVVFIASVNLNLTNNQISKLIQLFKILVLIQLPAAIIKLALVGGVAEKNIGTMGITGGSLHLIFPLILIGFLLGIYFHTNKKTTSIVLIVLFILFGISGGKKGVPFYTIAVILLGNLIYTKYFLNKTINIGRILIVSIASVVILFFGVKLVPGLNKEKKIGGEFDTDFLIEKVYTYSFYDERRDAYSGRFGGTTLLLRDLFGGTDEWLNKKNPINTTFGYGPSSFDNDNYLTENPNINRNYNRIIPTGFLRMLFALGIFGVLGFILFYGSITYYLFKLAKHNYTFYNTLGQIILMGTLLAALTIWMDFFTYTHMYTYPVIFVSYFFFVGQLYRNANYLFSK